MKSFWKKRIKFITLLVYFIVCGLSLAEERFHSTYNKESMAFISFLKTEKENQIECVRVCIFNEANKTELEIYAQSAIHNGSQWVLNNGRSVSYDAKANEPVKMQKFEITVVAELPLSLEALYQKTEEFIVYFPEVHIFRPSVEKGEGIYFVSYIEEKFNFIWAEKHQVSGKENSSMCILTLFDGRGIRDPFSYPSLTLTLLHFDSMGFDLPFEALTQFELN